MSDKLQEFIADPKRHLAFEKESLTLEATELISSLMEQEGLNKAAFAKRIGRSKAYVTQLLNGRRNMTLHTVAEILFAFGRKAELKAVRLEAPRVLETFQAPQHFPLTKNWWFRRSEVCVPAGHQVSVMRNIGEPAAVSDRSFTNVVAA